MACVPRFFASRALNVAVCSVAAGAIRPARAAVPPACRMLAAASGPGWTRQKWTLSSPPLSSLHSPLAVRWSSGVSLTAKELEEHVLAILKMFDKVKPEKVGMLTQMINFYQLSMYVAP